MLSQFTISPTVAVKDLSKAKSFYEEILGLSPESNDEDPAGGGGVRYKCGDSSLYVYESAQNAGTNQATGAGWTVDNLNEVVDELKQKGLVFEKYDMPGVTHNGDIHVMGESMKVAWFKDPDGNIFAIDDMPAE